MSIRQTPSRPWCGDLGAGIFDIAYNFTLAAYNTSQPNANSTGAPLVLGQDGAIQGYQFKVLSTYHSFPYNDYPNLSLIHGSLIINSPEEEGQGHNVTAGTPPSFVATSITLPSPPQIYCGVADTDPAGGGTGFPVLAVHNDADSFYLCDTSYDQVNVIYKPTANNSGEYLYDTCYPVALQIIEPVEERP